MLQKQLMNSLILIDSRTPHSSYLPDYMHLKEAREKNKMEQL
jgi:hypothetical protein